jgi:transcription elongation factor GreA
MTTSRVWLTPRAHDQLRAELAALLAPPTGQADEDEHPWQSQYQRETRIRQLQDLLANAVVGQDPPDDGVAEPGMVLTVRYDDTGDTDTFLLAVHDADYGDIEVYSPASPLGMALIGARRGEQRSCPVPDGTKVRVTLLDAKPYGKHN